MTDEGKAGLGSAQMIRRYATGHGDERTVLLSFLDQYRDTMVFKIEGLDEEQARRAPTEQANSLLTLIVHLTGVEQGWTEGVVLGHEVDEVDRLGDLFHDRDAEFSDLVAQTTVPEAVRLPRSGEADERDRQRTRPRRPVRRRGRLQRALGPPASARGDRTPRRACGHHAGTDRRFGR